MKWTKSTSGCCIVTQFTVGTWRIDDTSSWRHNFPWRTWRIDDTSSISRFSDDGPNWQQHILFFQCTLNCILLAELFTQHNHIYSHFSISCIIWFPFYKVSFCILYTDSIYSGSLSYYVSHRSEQETSLSISSQSEFRGFNPYLVIRKVAINQLPIIFLYFRQKVLKP
jgi:hypothetical protein